MAGLVALLLLVGCGGDDAPPDNAAAAGTTAVAANTTPAPPPSEPPALLPASPAWSAEQAFSRLGDDDLRVQRSAAVQLIKLSGQTPTLMPGSLDDAALRALAVRPLGANHFAVGIGDTDDPQSLWAPVQLNADGQVAPLDADTDGPVRLVVSADLDLTPHVLIKPADVLVWSDGQWETGMRLVTPEHVRFALDEEAVVLRLNLVLTAAPTTEAATYRWDFAEMMFLGPLMDELPAPAVGDFELSLNDSTYLVPVGGLMPDPIETPAPGEEPPPEFDVELDPLNPA